ncbi:MAG: RHS repeat-associated core domain-containing protein, partial [Phycisphaerae bacterium]|nr:RHS repeat-associated core domain-containing protein [Phycisphaerae bacterium]
HQGLFWHSLDGSATFNTPDPAATPTATGLYYNRNRWYAPHLGRFLQRDPNESAMLVLDTLARNGEVLSAFAGAFDAVSHFGSGMNLYGYAGSNPITGSDALGLFDWFDEVDDILAQSQAERAEAAERVMFHGYMAQRIGVAALQVLLVSTCPTFALLSSGYGMYNAMLDIYENGLTWQNSISLGLNAATGAGGLSKAVSRFRGHRRATSAAYDKATGQLHHAISKKVHKALEKHPTLKGKYEYRDSRFVTRAVDEEAHRGYQGWHRGIDDEVAEWVKTHRDATEATFERFLRAIYKRPEMRQRFPDGL